MSRRTKTVMLAVIVAVFVGCIWILVTPSMKHNSIAYLARRYGVSKKSVEAVARAYDVNPEELDSYGRRPFPVNYIEHTLNWAWEQSEHPTIYRAEIEDLVTGYVSKCEIEDTITLYLFYSDWLRPKTLLRGEALPVEIAYKLDVTRDGTHDDQIVQDITYYELSDSGGWPWEQVAPHCFPPARY